MSQNISISFRDARPGVDRAVYRVPDTVTPAQVEAYVAAILPNLDDVVGGVITQVQFQITIDISGIADLKTDPEANSRNAAAASMSFLPANDVPDVIYLPGIKDAYVTGQNIDIASPLDTLVTQFTTGVDVSGTQIGLSDRYDSRYASLRRGKFVPLK